MSRRAVKRPKGGRIVDAEDLCLERCEMSNRYSSGFPWQTQTTKRHTQKVDVDLFERSKVLVSGAVAELLEQPVVKACRCRLD